MNLRKLRVCVIDDEAPIRKELVDELNASAQMKVIGQAESVKEGVTLVIETQPDAIFLDIKLREGDAFQVMDILRREMPAVPPVIINTGYSDFEYAQRVFNQYKDCVITILQKPFWEDWNRKESEIVDQILSYHTHTASPGEGQKVTIKSDYKTFVFDPLDIMYCEVNNESNSKGKVFIETVDRKLNINKSLSDLMKILPPTFLRVSRFLIVNMDHLDYYDHSDHVLYLKGLKRNFGVGSAYEQNIFRALE